MCLAIFYFFNTKVSTTWTMLRIMFSDPANPTTPGLKVGTLPLMNR